MQNKNDPVEKTTLRIRTIPHLANQLKINETLLLNVSKNADDYYKEFNKKVKGKSRDLVMAKKDLVTIQRRILTRILCRLPVGQNAYGAIKGRSIKDNATVHSKSPFIIKLDIKAFYPSIRFKKVYQFFIEQECTAEVARALTLLVTHDHSLPLGVSTSPMLADQIVRNIDQRISGMAKKAGLLYSRYVDDITLSGKFPLKRFTSLVMRIIRQAGFRIKKSKLEIYEPNDGKERIITGVGVNNGNIFVPHGYYDTLKKELMDAMEQSRHQKISGEFESKRQYLGRIGYARWLDPKAGQELLRIYRKVKWKHLEWAMAQSESSN